MNLPMQFAFPSCRTARRAAAAIGLVLTTLPAFAQNANKMALDDMKQMHDRLARPDAVVSVDDARNARKKIKEWGFERAALKPDQQESLLRLELYAALGVGDAAQALETASKLNAAAPGKRSTIEAAYLAAMCAGDAQRADARLRDMLEKASGADKEVATQRRRWVKQVGTLAPDVTIQTDDESYAARKREKRILVIDFWNTLKQPESGQIATLKRIYDENKASAAFQMVGVNADSESRLEKAREFARASGFEWKQLYEKKITGAPISHEAFKIGSGAWQVLIDGRGVIRAVGPAAEPSFTYALRASLAETFGEFKPLLPRNVEGEIPAELRPAEPEPKTPEVAVRNNEPLKSSPEAKNLWNQALVFMKTGKKSEAKKLFQEIVDKYPNSLEARDARDMLQNL